MRKRGNTDKPVPDDGEFESWIADLAGGEPTVRRLRQRLDAERDPVDDACPTCSGASTGEPGHLPALRTASRTAVATA